MALLARTIKCVVSVPETGYIVTRMCDLSGNIRMKWSSYGRCCNRQVWTNFWHHLFLVYFKDNLGKRRLNSQLQLGTVC